MRRILLFLLIVGAFQAKSQQNRFAFFQASPNEPFYIRTEAANFSSTAFGYLVIPKLNDGRFTFYIGFPNNKLSEQQFELIISGSDRGFEVKKAANGSIRLYDWQKMTFLEPLPKATEAPKPATEAKTDSYSKLMAGVVNDPEVAMVIKTVPVHEPTSAVKEQTVSDAPSHPAMPVTSRPIDTVTMPATASKVITHTDTVRPVKSTPSFQKDNDSLTQPQPLVKENTEPAPLKTDTVPREVGALEKPPARMEPAQTARESGISLLQDTSRDGYREILYVDNGLSFTDTVQVQIPLEVQVAQPDSPALYRVREEKKDTVASAPVSSVQLVNSDCKRFAADSDVDKLRVSILNANGNDAKVAEARKVFKSRCFSTKQVRALSELFSSDDGRLKFFEAAYPFVSDTGNFKNLVNLLEDSFYIDRFKALVRITD